MTKSSDTLLIPVTDESKQEHGGGVLRMPALSITVKCSTLLNSRWEEEERTPETDLLHSSISRTALHRPPDEKRKRGRQRDLPPSGVTRTPKEKRVRSKETIASTPQECRWEKEERTTQNKSQR